MKKSAICIRPGTVRDVSTILKLIRALAKYERLASGLQLNARRLRRDAFGRHRYCETLIAERDGRSVGYAIYYFGYSSFTCRPFLLVEDVFVVPEERGRGTGMTLMTALARIAVRKDCEQMEWIVLRWNARAIKFYHRLGARVDKSWFLTRLTGSKLRRLARGHSV